MPMNLDAVGAVSQPSRASWTSKDALLYALGVGAGQTDPTGFELEFTTENSTDVAQKVLPTMPVVISMGGGPGLPSWGEFDFRMLLHGEQGVTVHGPIPADGEVETVARIVGIYDKVKAAVIRIENKATYVDSGKPAFDTRFAAFIRGEGGFGESRGDEVADPPKMPDRTPDHEVTYATRARPGAPVPAQRRPQPVALRPDDREVRRLRPSDPARLVLVRVHGPGPAARAVWVRRGAVHEHGLALLETGHARRHAHRAHVGRRQGPRALPDGHPGGHRRHRRRRLHLRLIPNLRP